MSDGGDGGRVHDLTLGIEDAQPGWPGDPPVQITSWARLRDGAEAEVSEVRMGTHAGTHVDAPAHFLPGGATVDRLPLDVLVGDAQVVDLRGAPGPIGPVELEGAGVERATVRLLLKTDNSAAWHPRPATMPERYVALAPEGAAWLVERGVRLVGIDGISVDGASSCGYPVHRLLLAAGVVVVEALDMAAIGPGRYRLACLPLLLMGADGAPVRVVVQSLDGQPMSDDS